MNLINNIKKGDRKFVFLQGPHGPFFYEISRILIDAGVQVLKIGFNKGDEKSWADRSTYQSFLGHHSDWDAYFCEIIEQGATDVVLYGDSRSLHSKAIEIAKTKNITIHCFEEGYLRPYWATYERGGVNGNSRLMDMSLDQMRTALVSIDDEQPEVPANWGELRRHAWYGAKYHWHVFFGALSYPNFKPHRKHTIGQEFWSHAKRLILMPYRWAERIVETRKITNKGYVYHLALLQLSHDSSIIDHSQYENSHEFIREVLTSFAAKAPGHHHLVFKAHPLEDYRDRPDKYAIKIAKQLGIINRVHFLHGGKLASILDFARSVVTINSTAAQQALWRGLPVKTMGRSVYSKPEFTSTQPLADFFEMPNTPDMVAYRDYRRYLMATSQIAGGFYSRKSRVRLTRQAIDLVLSHSDPYELLSKSPAAPMQQIKLIK